MGDSYIYEVQGNVSKEYSIKLFNSGKPVEAYVALWSSDCSSWTKLNPTTHLLTKNVTGFSNWTIPCPTGGTNPSAVFEKAYEQVTRMQRENPHLTFELFIATDGTDFTGAVTGSYDQQKLVETCGRLVSLKNVTLTIPAGKTVVIAGNNGYGVEALINIISGIYTNYKGTAEVDGLAIKDVVNESLPMA
jgi:ABC-type multidrug transport system fused ATPase/permease subunit